MSRDPEIPAPGHGVVNAAVEWQAASRIGDWALLRDRVDIWRIGPGVDTQPARAEIIGRYLGRSDAVRFRIQPGGKPCLDTEDDAARSERVEFNLTHTRDLALLAITRGRAVGIDVERIRPVKDLERIAERVWPAAMQQALRSQSAQLRLRAFFDGWTRFEACQKAQGRGVFAEAVDPTGLHVVTFVPGAGFIASLAVAGRRPAMVRHVDYALF
jgi:hypothetical protein